PPVLASFPTRRSSDLYEVARARAPLMMEPERRPERSARVGCTRRDPHALVVRLFENAGIGDAIERNATRDDEIPRGIARMETARSEEHTSELQSRENL